MAYLIECDRCNKIIREDDYHTIHVDSTNEYHLCEKCYGKFMYDILNLYYEENEGKWEHKIKMTEGSASWN